MNYLAHIRLAGDSPESVTGNFLGDFVKGKLAENQYTLGIRRGIMMHRRIDAWTDSHEMFRQSARLVSPRRRRWGRIMVDVFYDHLLAKNWNLYSDESLEEFLNGAYETILEAADIFPERVAEAARAMIKGGWLEKYVSAEGLTLVFERMSARIERENPLAGAERELFKNYDEMNGHFREFFPQAVKYAKSLEESVFEGQSWRAGSREKTT